MPHLARRCFNAKSSWCWFHVNQSELVKKWFESCWSTRSDTNERSLLAESKKSLSAYSENVG
jgi:hypothetical protein